jgi:membrane protein required for colicin V production
MIGFATLDWVLVAFIVFFAAKGGWRGVVRESFGYVAILLGVFSLLAFGDDVALVLAKRLDCPIVPARIGGYVLSFLLPYLIVKMTAYLLRRFLSTIALGGVDRTVGVLFGALVGAIFAGSLLIAADRIGFGRGHMAQATLAPSLKGLFSYVVDVAFGMWHELARPRV